MSGEQKRDPLLLAGGGCLGVYGLVVVALLITSFAWRSSVAAMVKRAKRDSALALADAQAKDAFRARVTARAGLDTFLAPLQGGATPSPVKGDVGQSYAEGSDRYEVSFRTVRDGVYEVRATGQIVRGGPGGYGSPDAEEVLAECVLTARVEVTGDQVRVVSLDSEDTSPERPSEGD